MFQCGEGKCGGDDAKAMKTSDKGADSTKTDMSDEKATAESKSKDHKCGEGKCGAE